MISSRTDADDRDTVRAVAGDPTTGNSGPVDSAERRASKLRGGFLIVVTGATVLGLFETVRGLLVAAYRGLDYSWQEAVIGNMPWWYIWALATPLILHLAHRFRLDRGSWRTGVLPHAVASLALSLGHLLVFSVIVYYSVSRGVLYQSLADQLAILIGQYLVSDVITYWAILGSYYAVVYSRRLRTEELESARLEGRITEARLEALRLELNPHFLFNSLNAVSALIQEGQPEGAVRMLARLGDLFRQTLDRKGDREVTLATELKLVSPYLEIERYRFGDRLAFRLDIAPDTARALLPSFVLQPLIENAIRHGIACKRGPGTVELISKRNGERLVVQVLDTGVGVSARRMKARGEGVGLSNTRARLQELYDEDWLLTLAERAEGGTEVTLSLPLRYAEHGDAHDA